MNETREKILSAIAFLSPEAIEGLLIGTLEALEEAYPGYVDHLVLGALSIEMGMDPGEPYDPERGE